MLKKGIRNRNVKNEYCWAVPGPVKPSCLRHFREQGTVRCAWGHVELNGLQYRVQGTGPVHKIWLQHANKIK